MNSPRPTKRQRTALSATPPTSAHDPDGVDTLARAADVLDVQATALSYVCRLYQTDPVARDGLLRAVDTIAKSQEHGGKIIVCGVGKSGLVGRKTVATLKSMGVGASFMHAAEAAHGDLGDIREHDVVLFISFSGKTSELLNLLPHLAQDRPVIALTSHLKASGCPLLADFDNSILLPAPIHEPEETSFGICAPTTSTTVAMAIGDMLALTVADKMHAHSKSRVFKKNHPGGAIGVATLLEEAIDVAPATAFELLSPDTSSADDC